MSSAERSRLLNKHATEIQAAKKSLKTKKGLMLAEEQKKYDELVLRHEKELKEFDEAPKEKPATETAAPAAATTTTTGAKTDAPKSADPKAASGTKVLKEKKWDGLSKKELEDECALRGLGKKGNKEELVVKLVMWTQEHKNDAASKPTEKPKETNTTTTTTTNTAQPKTGKQEQTQKSSKSEKEEEEEEDDEEEEEEEEEDSSDEEDEKGNLTNEQLEEAEKQFKRETIVRKALKALLKDKYPNGFKMDDFNAKIAEANIKNFRVESLGYKTLRAFLKKQPDNVCKFDKNKNWVYPPR